MLIDKRTKQEIDGSWTKLLPTLVFCNHHHAKEFFFPSSASATPRADVGVPEVYETLTTHNFDGVFSNHNSDTVEKKKALVHRAMKNALECEYGLYDVPKPDMETTFLLEHERQVSFRNNAEYIEPSVFNVQELTLGSWQSEMQYKIEHIRCGGRECIAEDRHL
jgi:hypothetical protein